MENPSDIMARLNASKQKEIKKKTSAKTAPVESVKSFEISEAEIKSNPVYSIITDEKKTDQEKLEALHELKRYNLELDEAENEANREASNEFLLYVENQLMASSQKGIEFTNDNAFALYDETIQELFGNIKTFKGYIEPFVKALEVLQKAREAGISANELIDAVSEMQGNIAKMKDDKESKASELENLQDDLIRYNNEASSTVGKLEGLAKRIESAKSQKTNAEKSWNVFTKNSEVSKAQDDIDGLEAQVLTLSNTSKVTAENLDRQNASITSLQSDISGLDVQITEAEEEFAANENSTAIATLIEITGKDFKEKREEVVTAAKTITEKAIEGIEKSIGRFESGEDETGTQLNTVTNLNAMVGLLSTADKKVRISDAEFISTQKEIVDSIKGEKGDDAIYDPDYEIAKNHLDAANEHVSDVVASSARASDLEGKLTRQTGTFRGLRDAYGQKGQEATKLRTSAAVEIPAQLAITVKSVEMATASESNNMVNDAFADLSATTQKSVSSIFDTVSAGSGQNNEQLRNTLVRTLETIEMMNTVEADLKEKAKEGYTVRQDLERAQSALQNATGSVASASVDAEHEEMAKPKAPKASGPK